MLLIGVRVLFSLESKIGSYYYYAFNLPFVCILYVGVETLHMCEHTKTFSWGQFLLLSGFWDWTPMLWLSWQVLLLAQPPH